MKLSGRLLAVLTLLLCLTPLLAASGCKEGYVISDNPDVAREQLAEREAYAAKAQTALDTANGIVAELQAKLDSVTNERDTAQARADELSKQLKDARLAGELTGDQLTALDAAAAQARAYADSGAFGELIGRTRGALGEWTRHRDKLQSQLDAYLVSIEKQKAQLDAGTGGTGIGANLQIAGEQIQHGAQFAPPPVRGYGELIGWGLAAVGGLLTAGSTRKYVKTKAERDHEARMLDATVSSIEAAKQADTLGKIDLSDTKTRGIVDAVQNAVPGLKQRIDQITSKV